MSPLVRDAPLVLGDLLGPLGTPAPSARTRALRRARRAACDVVRAHRVSRANAPAHSSQGSLRIRCCRSHERRRRRLRPDAGAARPRGRLAARPRRLADARGRARVVPALARRQHRDRPARRLARRARRRRRGAARRRPAPVRAARRLGAAEPLPAPHRAAIATARASSSSTGRSTVRSRGARGSARARRRCISAARSTRSPRSERAAWRGEPADAPVRPPCPAEPVRSSARARRPAHRLGVLPRSERLARRHDGPDRAAGRAVRARASAIGSWRARR